MDAEAGRADRKKREVRERILAAAASLFIEKGSRAVSMDEVAQASDVARRTLFNYFESKDDLLFAAAAPVLVEAIAMAEARLGEPMAGLDDVIGLCTGLWRNYGRRLGLVYSVDLADSPRLAELHARYIDLLRRLISRASVGDPDLAERAELVGKLVYRSFFPLLLALEGEDEAEARFAGGLKALVKGAVGLPCMGEGGRDGGEN